MRSNFELVFPELDPPLSHSKGMRELITLSPQILSARRYPLLLSEGEATGGEGDVLK